MKKILVIGSTGQIGSELVETLRQTYGRDNVVAGYVPGVQGVDRLREGGIVEQADVTDAAQIGSIIDRYSIDTVYNLAALLSVVGEQKPLLAWHIQIDGVINLLELAREKRFALFTPSSIGAFGADTPKDKTPQDTVQHPRTMYGVSKVTTELLSDYYFHRYGVDTRSVRFPGIISYKTPPGGGTTDYAVEIFHAAVKGQTYVCPIAEGTQMDMMYMPDALKACVDLMEADGAKLLHRNGFNITAMSFDPSMIYDAIRREVPSFKMVYAVDPLRQSIAESWPNELDDTCARQEWGWKPCYDLNSMTRDMLENIKNRR